MPRLFIALAVAPVPPALGRMIDRLEGIGRPVRTAARGQLHVTLAFLGQVDERLIWAVGAAMNEAWSQAPLAALDLRGLGAFPSLARPHLVWAGLADPLPVAALERSLRPRPTSLGLALDDRRFHGHVTLARLSVSARSRRRAGPPPSDLVALLRDHAATPLGRVERPALHLVESTLTPRGPIHLPRHICSMSGTAADPARPSS